LKSLSKLLGQHVRLLRAAHVGERHIRAFFEKAFHDALADAARSAGDERDLVL
jgi:hypothetical protein